MPTEHIFELSESAARGCTGDDRLQIDRRLPRRSPRIVPREYFRSLAVEEGGYGAGTRIRVDMMLLGAGAIERFVAARMVPTVYRAELAQSAEVTTDSGANHPYSG